MYITHTNLQPEIRKMTDSLIIINTRLQQRINAGKYTNSQELINDDEIWEWNIDLLNEIMAFIKKECPEIKYDVPDSPEKKLMNQVHLFFHNMNQLNIVKAN